MAIRIATWNVNSIRIRLDGLARLVKEANPDIVCLQETKVEDALFPRDAVREMGFSHLYVKGQKGYNGVALLSKLPLTDVECVPVLDAPDCRHISARLPDGTELHNFYVPAGGDIPDPVLNPSFDFKLKFMEAVTDWFSRNRRPDIRMILVGDLNIAPLPTDVWSHKQLLGVVSHTPMETERMEKLRGALDWCDTARHFVPPSEKLYTWWSYRNRDWRKSDRGRRLDHIWVTPPLQSALRDFHALKDARDWQTPSDHVPVIAELAL